MASFRNVVVMTVGLVVVATCLQAAEPPLLVRGQRVRLTVPSRFSRPLVGTLDGLSADTIAVPRVDVTRVQVSRGRPMAFTAVLGVLAGTKIGRDAFKCPSYSEDGCYAVVGIVPLAVVGGLVGAVAGTQDFWKDVPAKEFRVNFMPARGGGAGVFVSWAF
jgi:hypothetical protein